MNIISTRRKPVNQNNGQRRHKPDYLLLVISILLLIIGLIVVYAISPALGVQTGVGDNYFINRHAIAVFLGIVAFIVVSLTKPQFWKKLEYPLLGFAFISSIAVRLFGEEVNGAYRWIQIGGFSFQAAELIKFALIIWLAGFLVRRINEGNLVSLRDTLMPLFVTLIAISVIVAGLQSDLGSAAVMMAVMGAMIFVAGMPMRNVAVAAAVILIGITFFIGTSEYRTERVQTFLNPTADCEGAGYQACQALITIGSGGIFGRGVGQSVQAYGYLPEAANDSIFAIYAEKFGFLGSVVLISLFVALFVRLKNIINKAPDNYTRLIVVGVLTWISAQSVINIGAMIGVLPIKGITLPFVSYGGTSILFVAAAVGLVFSISRYTSYRSTDIVNNEGRNYESNISRRRDGRPHNPTVSRRP